MSGKVRVTMERGNCISCGNCWNTCPDFFEQNPEDGQSQIAMKHRLQDSPSEGEAPEDREDCVRAASAECPAEVIHVE